MQTVRLSPDRLLAYLDVEFSRVHDLAGQADLSAQVPTCPGWTLDDLLWHLTTTYRHKVEAMRRNAWPKPWPPPRTGEPVAEQLAEAYAQLTAEFAARGAGEATVTWYEPDQSVGFWIRRMTHETVLHRVDAELAAGVAVSPIAADVALDGVDEVLKSHLEYLSVAWREDFVDLLAPCTGQQILVQAGPTSWLVTVTPEAVGVVDADPTAAATTVSGPAPAVLRWLWRRADDGTVDSSGDTGTVALLRELMRVATQ